MMLPGGWIGLRIYGPILIQNRSLIRRAGENFFSEFLVLLIAVLLIVLFAT
jgi:hypothetical protein